MREVAPRLMRAHGDESGLWVIERDLASTGAVALADQKVQRDGEIHHYHQALLHEFRPDESERFSFWILVHEFDAFERAWA